MSFTELENVLKNKKIAAVFPGQASQYKQMGINWYKSFSKFKNTIDYINQKIKQEYQNYLESDLFEILENEEKLNLTLYSQISIFAVSIASYETFIEFMDPDQIVCFTGHSLGEYSALVCSKSLTLDQGIDLVVKRGYFMNNYSKNGTMFAVIYQFNTEKIEKLQMQS
ncbi:MAG: ACP S-malonyltransferase [bacterium]